MMKRTDLLCSRIYMLIKYHEQNLYDNKLASYRKNQSQSDSYNLNVKRINLFGNSIETGSTDVY